MSGRRKYPGEVGSEEWSQKRNAARRKRYHRDRKYQENARDAARESYRTKVGGARKRDLPDTDEMLRRLRKNGKRCRVVATPLYKKPMGRHTIVTFTNMAQSIGRHDDVVREWIRNGVWPEPVAETAEGGTPVYLMREAVALARVYGEHSKRLMVLRRDHTDTISRLFAAVELIRKKEVGI